MENLAELLVLCINKKETETLTRCLQIYVTLDKVGDAEKLVRRKIIGPALENIIVEGNLQNDPFGLQGIYLKLLNFLNSNIKLLLDVTSVHDRFAIAA